jgi:hypothetical protein
VKPSGIVLDLVVVVGIHPIEYEVDERKARFMEAFFSEAPWDHEPMAL